MEIYNADGVFKRRDEICLPHKIIIFRLTTKSSFFVCVCLCVKGKRFLGALMESLYCNDISLRSIIRCGSSRFISAELKLPTENMQILINDLTV